MRPLSSLIPGLALVLSVSLATACGGAKKYEEDPNWASKDTISTEDDASAFVDARRPQIGDLDDDWVGVRPDLAITRTRPRKQSCNCLSVELGTPFEPQFTWEGTPPKISGNKMAIAVSAFGIECPGGAQDQAERRPSIRAVDRRGNDVIVVIEDIPVDRPVASGAVFNPPGAGGAIYVRPYRKSTPYARTGSNNLCRVL
jgi:hypothetical protein